MTVFLSSVGPQATGGAGTHSLIGIEGLSGSLFDDRLTGDGAANRLQGADGNDTLDGAGGADTLAGGRGDDTYFLDVAQDVVLESFGEGIDTVISAASIVLALNVENAVYTGPTGGSIQGNALDNLILSPATGLSLDGAGGNDTVSYRNLNIAVTVNLASGLAQVGANTDTLFNFENAEGGSANDSLTGNAGANILDGEAGADTMTGGLGTDTYYVDDAGDQVVEIDNTLTALPAGLNLGSAIDRVIASISYALTAFVENLDLAGATAPLSGTGNLLDNLMNGNAGANLMAGVAGNDTLNGLAGNDTLDGGDGNDSGFGGDGNDSLSGGIGNDTLNGDLGFDLLDGGDGADSLAGGLNADTLLGGAGDDFVGGGQGTDSLVGGAGNDTIVGGLGTDRLEGGPGADRFVFRHVLDGTNNIDTFVDLESGVDVIELSASIFTALAPLLGTKIGTQANLIYNSTTGALGYDADGPGAIASITFAVVGSSTHPANLGQDFLVVA